MEKNNNVIFLCFLCVCACEKSFLNKSLSGARWTCGALDKCQNNKLIYDGSSEEKCCCCLFQHLKHADYLLVHVLHFPGLCLISSALVFCGLRVSVSVSDCSTCLTVVWTSALFLFFSPVRWSHSKREDLQGVYEEAEWGRETEDPPG